MEKSPRERVVLVMFNTEGLFTNVVTVLVVGVLSWVAYTTQQVSVQQAIVATQVADLKELITSMEENFMAKDEAQSRLVTLEQEMFRLRDRVWKLENEDG